MSQIKKLLPIFVLAGLLLWPLAALASDLTPDTCLSLDGMCYASNTIHDGTETETDPDGTALAPWLVPRDGAMGDLRDNVVKALKNPSHSYGDGPFFFAAIWCEDGMDNGCDTTWTEFDRRGREVRTWTEPGTPPEVGVPMPFGYLLGGGVVLGGLLIGVGIILRRRAQ